MNGYPDAEIYEANGTKLKNPVIFAGFVGAGLVGTISVDYIINKLDINPFFIDCSINGIFF